MIKIYEKLGNKLIYSVALDRRSYQTRSVDRIPQFLWIGFSCLKAAELLRGGSLGDEETISLGNSSFIISVNLNNKNLQRSNKKNYIITPGIHCPHTFLHFVGLFQDVQFLNHLIL